jgi:hypothetical protein
MCTWMPCLDVKAICKRVVTRLGVHSKLSEVGVQPCALGPVTVESYMLVNKGQLEPYLVAVPLAKSLESTHDN